MRNARGNHLRPTARIALELNCQIRLSHVDELRRTRALSGIGRILSCLVGSGLRLSMQREFVQRIGQDAPIVVKTSGSDSSHGTQLCYRGFVLPRVLFQQRKHVSRIVKIGLKRDGSL